MWVRTTHDFVNMDNVTHVKMSKSVADGRPTAKVYFGYSSAEEPMEYDMWRGDDAEAIRDALIGLATAARATHQE